MGESQNTVHKRIPLEPKPAIYWHQVKTHATSGVCFWPWEIINLSIRVLAKIRYTWPLFGQNQLHAKNKCKPPPRSPAIGQADIVTDFGSKRPRYTCFFVLLSINSFQLILANFEPIREAIRALFFLSVCVCPPSVWNYYVLTCTLCTRTSYASTYLCMHTCVGWFHIFFFGMCDVLQLRTGAIIK